MKYTVTGEMNWYVLYVKARQELKVQGHINNLGIDVEAFCPTRIETRIWSDRKKRIKVPLLSSMVLIKAEERNRDKVFAIPGTLKYLFWQGKPAIVKQVEVDTLCDIAKNDSIVSHEMEALKPGRHVDLGSLGFSNVNGIVQKVSKNTCWFILETLGYTIKITLK